MLTAYDITGEQYHHTREDVDTLHALGRGMPPGAAFVNIGACFGTSALALLEGQPIATVFSIDVNPCPDESENLKRAGVRPGRVIRILGRSQEVGYYWPFAVPLVFVDGAHDAESVRDDILAWTSNLTPAGIIAFHDYGTPSLPHVKLVVDNLMADWAELFQRGTIKAFVK